MVVGGPLCESGDIFTQEEGGFVRTRSLPEAKVGDYLVIECAGAYGFVMGSNYNTKPLAAEVLIDGRPAAPDPPPADVRGPGLRRDPVAPLTACPLPIAAKIVAISAVFAELWSPLASGSEPHRPLARPIFASRAVGPRPICFYDCFV